MTYRLHTLVRGKSPIRPVDALRGGGGALLGLLFAGLLGRFAVGGGDWLHPLLVAPIGASAVLVFAVPASPLAQPRSVLCGNIISALVGITVALLIPQPMIAAPLAVGLAIATMMLLGCLHPPGGAVALICVIGGPKVAQAGYLFALNPVAVDSLLLVAAGMAWGRLTGHAYPHHAPAPAKAAPPAAYSPADLDQALARYGELLDVDREDLDALFREVEQAAAQRLHGQIRCGEVMSRPAPEGEPAYTLREDAPISTLLPVLSGGVVREAVVVDAEDRPVGVVTQTDLLAALYRAHVVESVVGA